MSIIAKYKFDKTIYADLLPEFNAEFTSDKYNTTDEEVDGIITRTIESDELPTLMRFGRLWVEGETDTDNRTDSLLEVLDMNTSGLTSCGYMFRSNRNLTSISCEWVTSNITTMTNMFAGCNNLTSLDVSNFNTSNVADMYGMFYNCISLTSLDVSNFNTGNVTNMSYMFAYCSNLTSIDVSNFNTSNVASMEGMFNHCYNLVSIDVSNFNTSKVTSMSCMFNYCKSLTSLDVSNFDISSVARMDGMFSVTDKLVSLDISNFSISDTTKIDYILTSTPLLTDIGMLYCDQSTINKVASLLPINVHRTIWVEDVDIKDLTPVEGVEFKQYAKNTEIMLTSPLLEGDKLIVKDGKLYHYHKMGMVVLDGSENWWKDASIGANTSRYGINIQNAKNTNTSNKLMCNLFTCSGVTTYGTNVEDTQISDNNLYIRINTSKAQDVVGFKQWLQANPTTVVYELASPYYELISEDPLDISLISETVDITNSSNIPLNMTINNKGLSTIAIKPSSTYTVAFDKEGEEDLTVNLCGNEITTSNNIVEITTPSEIDDELIFYGDGVEVSNVRLLEGSVSGDSVPRETFKGLKNSFEEGYIPENVITKLGIIPDISQGEGITILDDNYTFPGENSAVMFCHSNFSKPHTFVVIPSNDSKTQQYTVHSMTDSINVQVYQYALGFHTFLFNQPANMYRMYTEKPENSTFRILILEGDWTHLAEEDFNHLGKYKVEYKVTGKNKYNKDKYPFGNGYSLANSSTNTEGLDEVTSRSEMFKLLPNTTYTYSADLTLDSNVGSAELFVLLYNDSGGVVSFNSIGIESTGRYSVTFSTDSVGVYCELRFDNNFSKTGNEGIVTIDNIQLEEGSVATPYEPYKSYTKTFYLNSPLLTGDTIEDINGVATHVKRYGKVVLDGSEEWFISTVEIPDDTTLVAFKYRDVRFANSGSSITFCENYSTDTNIVIRYLTSETVRNFNHNFNNMELVIKKEKLLTEDVASLKVYLRDNPITVYCKLASPILEPISTEPILCDSYVNGHLDVDTNIPIEKVQFQATSLALKYLNSNKNYKVQFDSDGKGNLDWAIGGHSNGIKENIVKGKNVFSVITGDKLNNDRLYMTGIGFNASNIQVVATDRNADFGYFKGLQSSFEEKTTENLFDESCLSTWWLVTATNIDKTDTSGKYFSIITKAEEGKKYTIKYDYMNRYIYAFLDENYEILKGSSEISMFTTFQAPKNTKYLMCYISSNGIKEEDYDNIQVVENSENFGYEVKCKVVGKNKLADKYKVEGYLAGGYGDNATKVNLYKGSDAVSYIIPCKPNTEYILSNGNGDRNALAFSSDYPRHAEILNLTTNGRITTNNNAKWLMVYVNSSWVDTDLNCQLEEGTQATSYEPYQEYTKTIYLNSPLLKGDTIEVHNGKLCHYHKMGIVVFDGSENWGDSTSTYGEGYRLSYKLMNAKEEGFLITDKFRVVEHALNGNTQTNIFLENIMSLHTYSNLLYVYTKLALNDFKQWLQANPTTAVYELAEPYYEEISPLQEDLIITSVKEGDLHIDTTVPVSSKVTYNVNVQLLTDFEQSIVEQVQATQTTDLQSILDEEIDN